MKSFKPDCGTVDRPLNLVKNIFALLFAAKGHIATIMALPEATECSQCHRYMDLGRKTIEKCKFEVS